MILIGGPNNLSTLLLSVYIPFPLNFAQSLIHLTVSLIFQDDTSSNIELADKNYEDKKPSKERDEEVNGSEAEEEMKVKNGYSFRCQIFFI